MDDISARKYLIYSNEPFHRFISVPAGAKPCRDNGSKQRIRYIVSTPGSLIILD